MKTCLTDILSAAKSLSRQKILPSKMTPQSKKLIREHLSSLYFHVHIKW